MISQLTKRSTTGILKRSMAFQNATVRYQSNKTASSDDKTKADLAAKVAKQKQSTKYNALSNSNLLKQQSQTNSKAGAPKKVKRTKPDYSSVPRVPSTTYYTHAEVVVDQLVQRHRPLLLFNRRDDDELSSLPSYYQPKHFWNKTLAGKDSVSEWNNVPYEVASKLKAFHPPPSPLEKIENNAKELEDYIESVESNGSEKAATPSTSKSKSAKRTKTRGRYRPSYDFDYNNNPDDY